MTHVHCERLSDWMKFLMQEIWIDHQLHRVVFGSCLTVYGVCQWSFMVTQSVSLPEFFPSAVGVVNSGAGWYSHRERSSRDLVSGVWIMSLLGQNRQFVSDHR